MSALVLLLISVFSSAVHGVTVQTSYGPVEGQTLDLHNGKSINTFLAIPFAKPPVGDLRFQKPENPDPWTEVFQADTYGNACPQSGGTITLTHPFWDKYSEDCLNLNIYTPSDASGGPYPVMVFFHGGAYQSSANIQYPGHFMASRDTVVVVPNYRLAIFGFLTTSDSVAPGNYGIWDQILALRYIQDNIGAFGGDPGKVTIFGQSAGAGSSGIMLVSPEAAGLFHQAILESGSELAIWSVAAPESQPENYTKTVAEQLNCPTSDSQSMMDCLKTKGTDELRNARFNCSDGYVCLGMQPVVDGPGGVLPDTPRKLREAGQYNRATVMAGFTEEDGALYVPVVLPPDIDLDQGLNRSDFERIVRNTVAYVGQHFPGRREDVVQAILYQYTSWPWKDDIHKTSRELVMMATDIAFAATADYHLKVVTQEDPTYMYVYSYRSKMFNNTLPNWMGVPHMMELPYVFGLTQVQLNPNVRNQTDIFDWIDWDQEDIEYADFTMDLWTNFAKTGNPTPSPVPAPGDNPDQTWEEYELGHCNFFFINYTMENKLNYRQKEFAFWTQYLSWMVGVNTPPIPADQDNTESLVLDPMVLSDAIGQYISARANSEDAKDY